MRHYGSNWRDICPWINVHTRYELGDLIRGGADATPVLIDWSLVNFSFQQGTDGSNHK